MSDISLKQIQLGPMQNFVYLLGCKKTKDFAIVDPAWDVPSLLSQLKSLGGVLKAVFLTHGHHDHVNGLQELLSIHDVPVYFSSQSSEFLTPTAPQLIRVENDHKIQLGNLSIRCIHTPGHSHCGVCYLVDGHLIAGDTLFIDGCGRCDFDSSDPEAMYESIHHKLMALPDDTIIYPGHDYGPKSTDILKNQKISNRFMSCKTKEKFLRLRMGTG